MFNKGCIPFNKGLTGLQSKKIPSGNKFQKGHTSWKKSLVFENAVLPDPVKSYTRTNLPDDHSSDVLSRDVPSTSTASTVNAKPECILRPHSLKKEDDWVTMTGSSMRLVDDDKMFDMFNAAMKQHKEMSSACSDPEMAAYQRKKWGVCWMYRLKCRNCTFVSPTTDRKSVV